MTEAKHTPGTPGPWEVRARGAVYAVPWNSHVTTVAGGPEGHEDALANARHIVLCVNAHADLVAALEAICEFWDEAEAEGLSTSLSPDAFIGGGEDDPHSTIHEVARAALKKARGE